jgi:hypothetical protein
MVWCEIWMCKCLTSIYSLLWVEDEHLLKHVHSIGVSVLELCRQWLSVALG